MKRIVTAAILMLGLLTCTALSASAQEIRFKKTRVTVKEAIEEIKEQTDYGFSYSKRLFDDSRIIILPSSEIGIGDLVGLLVAGTNHTYLQQGEYIVIQPLKQNEKQSDAKPIKPAATVSPTGDVYTRSNIEDFSGRRRRPLAPPSIWVADEPEVIKDSVSSNNTKNYTSRYFQPENYIIKERPVWALKTNLLYGLGTLTPNLALEVGLGKKTSLEFSGSYNPWKLEGSLESNKKLVHMILRPEFRYWTCERFNGHFFGVHAFYARYNTGTHDIPLLFEKEYRYDGYAVGGGLTYGYHLMLGRHWALEFNIGIGAAYMSYDKYLCSACET